MNISQQEYLFNKFIELKYKMQMLAGVVQNPVEDTIYCSDDIESWLSEARKVHQEFVSVVKQTKSFLYDDLKNNR